MSNWKTAYLVLGSILCLSTLYGPEFLKVGTVFAASAAPQSAIGERSATGPPQILGPRAGKSTEPVLLAPPAARLAPWPATGEDAVCQKETAAETPSIMSLQHIASDAKQHPQLEKTERQSRLELAIVDFVNFVRAMSQFAVRLVMGPKSLDTETTGMAAGIGIAPDGSARANVSESEESIPLGPR